MGNWRLREMGRLAIVLQAGGFLSVAKDVEALKLRQGDP